MTLKRSARVLLVALGLALGAGAARADDPAPRVSLTPRGVVDTLVRGEPLLVALRLSAPRDAQQAFELAPSSGTWADAIRVEILPAAGSATAALRAEAVGRPETPRATLDRARVAVGLWRFPAEATQQLAAGEYRLRATLAIAMGAGWTGTAQSDDWPLIVVAADGSPERVNQLSLARARDALLGGRLAEAARELDGVLLARPDDLAALTLRAEAALRAGNPVAALRCARLAERRHPVPEDALPLLELRELRERASVAFFELSPEAIGAIPADTWPLPPACMPTAAELELVAGSGAAAAPSSAAPPSAAPPAEAPAQVTAAPRAAPVTPVAPAPPAASAATAAGGGAPPRVVTTTGDRHWATGAQASSQYRDGDWSARQATGAPDVPAYGDSPQAWATLHEDAGPEWLELSWSTPVRARGLSIVQNFNPGALAQVDLIATDGSVTTTWRGPDGTRYPPGQVATLDLEFAPLPAPVARVKLLLDTRRVRGWNEIDAVALVGELDAAAAAAASRLPQLHWARSAVASSQYEADNWSASQATGAPDVAAHGDNPQAWASREADRGPEWLELSYATPIHATAVRVVQSFNPGALVVIQLTATDGSTSTVWNGPDTTAYASGQVGVLEVKFPRTEKPISRVRLVLDSRLAAGWNAIDAVGLFGVPE